MNSFILVIRKNITLINQWNKKKYIYLFLFFSVISSIFEIGSISILIPLTDVLLNITGDSHSFKLIYLFTDYFQIDKKYLNLYLVLVFTFFIIVSYLLKILLVFLSTLTVNELHIYIMRRFFYNTIHQEYDYFKQNNTSSFISGIQKTDQVRGSVLGFIQLLSSTIVASSIFLMMLFINFKITISFILIFSILYFLIFLSLKRPLTKISVADSKLVNLHIKLLIESFDNIKEIILRKLENFFYEKHDKIINQLKTGRIKISIFQQVPGQIILLVVSLILIIYIYILSLSESGIINKLPLLAAMIFSAQRLIPQIQNIYNSLITLKDTQYSFEDVFKVLNYHNKNFLNKNSINKLNRIKNSFRIENFSFKYNSQKNYIFEKANINFELNNIYGIKGLSGSGKTTLVDIILGLQNFNEGKFYVDNHLIDINHNTDWQSLISHISQNTILADSTIIENIAYGFKLEDINISKAKEAASKAEILYFVESLDYNFYTNIGERGARISGGQRQRLSIAKAFYLDKQIIILDESTNALDSETEKKIFENLRNIKKNRIIIVINHHNKLDNFFDYVFEVKDKKIKIIR
jgi:ABC-type bacteriocin/lantibiotic exporter with double-glycine peptidase domain